MCTIRSFMIDDLLHFNNVNIDIMTETYTCGYYLNYIIQWPEYCVTAQDYDDTIMGYVFGKSETNGLPWHGHITALTVAEDYRRLGLGSQMIAGLEKTSDIQDCYFVDLYVRVSNVAAVNMYKKLGYSIYNKIKNYYSGERDEDAYDMRKCLSADPNEYAGAFAGVWALYATKAPYYIKNPRHKIILYALASGCFYISFARWNLYPPFTSLREEAALKEQARQELIKFSSR
ncbi:N-alpha-acetyltransferase 20 [Strongyloides ratti]|uniref:N-alpha-acetyltransferase 20 n=1 Tax=Strongyloides ratti TaxID=34506 RepID=A0A090LID3_STRRB|nr:N-alpha-acetyltransferase 20 [Strongyloides ratti]CEF69576.1 N-alpha-acetyltransferase 20 [Strongyloides ratti]